MTITHAQSVIDRLLEDRPVFHQGGNARWDALPGTLGAILAGVLPGARTLETGVGASTVVFAACGAAHTAISPDAAEHRRVVEYAESIGLDTGNLTFIEGLSDDVLPVQLGHERVIDFAFIDGAHSFPFPAVDWHYISRALKIGGRLLLDDVPIPAVVQLYRHMNLEPNWRLDGVFDDRSAEFTLLSEPAPENWTTQPFNDGYPIFEFGSVSRKMQLNVSHRVGSFKRSAANKYPALKRAYHYFTK